MAQATMMGKGIPVDEHRDESQGSNAAPNYAAIVIFLQRANHWVSQYDCANPILLLGAIWVQEELEQRMGPSLKP